MADGDSYKTKVKRTLFPTHKHHQKKVRLEVSEKWYRTKRPTMNAKLRQAIIDVMPFDTDNEKADRILDAIFDTIVKGAIAGRVVIPGLGRFFLRRRNACFLYDFRTKTKTYRPERYLLGFEPAKAIVRCEGNRGE